MGSVFYIFFIFGWPVNIVVPILHVVPNIRVIANNFPAMISHGEVKFAAICLVACVAFDGIDGALARKVGRTDIGVLVLSQYVEEAYALDLLSESTERTGYLLKDRVSDVDTFTDAVRRVANGGSAIDPEVVALLLGRRRREDPLEQLSPRERECLVLAFQGLTARQSAERLQCTERTVNYHIANAMNKLKVDNKMAAIQRACWLGAI